jgi:hypothetical protein
VSTRPNSITQPTLFDPRAIDVRFDEFHREHPEVYRLIVRLCRKLRHAGRTHYSIDAILHRVRWHYDVNAKRPGEPFKLNDHFTSRYARLVMRQEPDLSDFFETRKLRAQ